ncbi:hypothetical protein GQ43DRAFT_373977 [Delitschia confertaspora ATCC 74209]|uniref:Uncharacterized protein n=1 Tax=Delitschia confertaspora ATCC 74209 TaxID=1513339 RepID=A0A9P4JJ31_9PLEO|nr:hypothetical protein GQ43DRAFT_373977 [Delitschia confertaspora ATCC 74209]
MPKQSEPVVIPPRTTRTPTSTQTVRVRGQNGARKTRVPGNHRPDAIPPAVAALLAVTAIPPLPIRRRKGTTMHRRISMDELIQEWRQDDSDMGSSVTGSPLDVLLDRLDEYDDEEYDSMQSTGRETDSMTSGSVSSESIASTLSPPSLDPDSQSLHSTWDSPSTPPSTFSRRSSSERREKIVQSPPKEDCVLDHPLLYFNQDDCEDIANLGDVPDVVTVTTTPSARFRSLKSNLTASFQALKEAAKSFSNFTAPSVPPEDFLTRSLLSPEFTSEMRPKQYIGLPSPALRRYLNPPAPTSPKELSMALNDTREADADSSAPMIQMQTYDKRNNRYGRNKRQRISEASKDTFSIPAVRQREPRENPDFLRVIVLELNMRRVGKLDTKAVGKARVWLPPRKSYTQSTAAEDRVEGRVPNRWVGISAEDL